MGQANSKHARHALIGAAALLGSVTIAARSRAKCQRTNQEEHGDHSALDMKENVRHTLPQDHPLVAWLIENSCVLLVGLLIPTPIPDNLASPLLSAIVDCVLDQCFIKQPLICALPPVVDLLVVVHPAQSVSQHTSMCVAGTLAKSYLKINLGLPT